MSVQTAQEAAHNTKISVLHVFELKLELELQIRFKRLVLHACTLAFSQSGSKLSGTFAPSFIKCVTTVTYLDIWAENLCKKIKASVADIYIQTCQCSRATVEDFRSPVHV